MRLRGLTLACALVVARVAAADPVVLRLGTAPPDGTSWAQQARLFTRKMEGLTAGQVLVKWYFGGIAGDELAVLERIKKGQIDGEVGTNFCDRLSPALRVMKILGLFQSREEIQFVLSRLMPIVDQQMLARGFVNLGLGTGFGERIVFSRAPVRNIADLRKTRPWIWNLDEVERLMLDEMGIPIVFTALEDASRTYEAGRADGFLTVPTGALVFQWSVLTRYYTELHANFLPACLALSAPVFDQLTPEQQATLKHVSAELVMKFNEVGQKMDDQLLHDLFEKHGLQRVPLADSFQREFNQAAQDARVRLGTKLVPAMLMNTVEGWLDEYRPRARPGAVPRR